MTDSEARVADGVHLWSSLEFTSIPEAMILPDKQSSLLMFSTCRTRTASENFPPIRRGINHPLRWRTRRHGGERNGRGRENRGRRIRRTSILATLSNGDERRDGRANGLPFGPTVRLHSLSSPPIAMPCESYGVVFHADGFVRLSSVPLCPLWLLPFPLWDATVWSCFQFGPMTSISCSTPQARSAWPAEPRKHRFSQSRRDITIIHISGTRWTITGDENGGRFRVCLLAISAALQGAYCVTNAKRYIERGVQVS
jgi:hypothetical protein